jgi:phage host-nuclease inhibitor protein Gam
MKPIKTWDEVDLALRGLASLDTVIEGERNDMNRECQNIKERYGARIKAQEDQKKEVLELLERFFVAHETDSEVKGKTYESNFGKCGLRMTPPAVKPIGRMTWERVLTRIIDLGWAKKYLRPLVHTIKDINRELLASKEVDDITRKEVGVKLHQEERFWYEIK